MHVLSPSGNMTTVMYEGGFPMPSSVSAGVIAGLIGGIVFGMGMQMMTAPTPDGGQMPMIAMVGQVPKMNDPTGSLSSMNSETLGWIYHFFNSAVIGAIFGLLVKSGVRYTAAGLGWGALYGFAWWILGGLVLMPLLLRMPAFAPLMMAPMRPVAMGSLMGHLVFGLVLGAAYAWLYRPAMRRLPAA
jgi:uncharacterized membrane protein YagU involved in acid resistance